MAQYIPGPSRGLGPPCCRTPTPNASMTLDFTQTLAFAGLVLFIGYGIKRAVPLLTRYNLPAPVIGGLLVALLITATRRPDWAPITFDTALQPPLMIAFFTTIGFAASLSLLRVGGPQVAALLPARGGDCGGPEHRRGRNGQAPRPASADGRARRIGDADRRARYRPGVRAGVRRGGRSRRRHARGRVRDGGHRRRRHHGRPDRDRHRRATEAAPDRVGPQGHSSRRSPRTSSKRRRGSRRRARPPARTSRRTGCSRRWSSSCSRCGSAAWSRPGSRATCAGPTSCPASAAGR